MLKDLRFMGIYVFVIYFVDGVFLFFLNFEYFK